VKHRYIIELDIPDDSEHAKDNGERFVEKFIPQSLLHSSLILEKKGVGDRDDILHIRKIFQSFKLVRKNDFPKTEVIH
jgi:hypothetical protein